jgi:hypothetical protein
LLPLLEITPKKSHESSPWPGKTKKPWAEGHPWLSPPVQEAELRVTLFKVKVKIGEIAENRHRYSLKIQ